MDSDLFISVVGWILLPFIGLGSIGNRFSFIIWTRGESCKNSAASVYLTALSVADTVSLLSATDFAYEYATKTNYVHYLRGFMCRIVPTFWHFTMMTSSYIVVCVTVDRVIAVFAPTADSSNTMLHPVIPAVVCGVSAVGILITVVLLCRHLRKRKHRTCVSTCGYDAIGDCKPSMMSVTPSTSQDIQISKEHRTVQPRSTSISSRGSISTMSRGSIKSDPFAPGNEDTSSISARSDTSIDSHVFDPSFGAIRPDLYPRKDAVLQQSSLDRSSGRLHVRLKYDFRTSDLIVHLIEAQDLPPSEHLDPDMGFGDPYVKVSIEPGVDERVRQSSVKRKTANPFYNEYFKFPATYDDIRARAVVFVVYDYDKFSRHKLVGEVRIDLSKVETSNSVEMWCDIQKQKLESAELGELLVSLSYLPTAERLTVVVMKAKDLRVPTTTPSSDPYVRITLVIDGKKVKRKKTSVKKGTHNPVWNEALSFNVPAELLPKVILECHVIDNDLIGHGEFVGCCVIGSNMGGNEGRHWNDMIQNQRKSMAMWHPLHP